jgi:hypothetical protein
MDILAKLWRVSYNIGFAIGFALGTILMVPVALIVGPKRMRRWAERLIEKSDG